MDAAMEDMKASFEQQGHQMKWLYLTTCRAFQAGHNRVTELGRAVAEVIAKKSNEHLHQIQNVHGAMQRLGVEFGGLHRWVQENRGAIMECERRLHGVQGHMGSVQQSRSDMEGAMNMMHDDMVQVRG